MGARALDRRGRRFGRRRADRAGGDGDSAHEDRDDQESDLHASSVEKTNIYPLPTRG